MLLIFSILVLIYLSLASFIQKEVDIMREMYNTDIERTHRQKKKSMWTCYNENYNLGSSERLRLPSIMENWL